MNDVIAVVGEALVDFVQPGPEPIFEAFVGGSPANVAVGLARLVPDPGSRRAVGWGGK